MTLEATESGSPKKTGGPARARICFVRRTLVIPLAGACLVFACSTGANHPPRIAPIPALTVVVGDLLVYDLLAEDPDGDDVSFQVSGAPEGARVAGGSSSGWRFEYAPLASHAGPGGRRYDLVFTASDGRGGRTEEATTLTVWPEASTPVFVGPFAWSLNLAEEDHLATLVKVRDDDSAHVTLALRRGVEGARLDQVDGHSATFYFRPRPSQVAPGAVFTLTIGALDGDHPEVLQDFAVVLVNADLFGGCPGSPPSAFHPGLSDQHGSGPYPLEVRARDPDSPVREVTAFWSAVKGLDEGEMNRLTLSSGQDGVFRGAIPDLSAAAGKGRLVFYHFRVTDDDDPTGVVCDQAVRLPAQGEFAFAAYGPEGAGECLEDEWAGTVTDLPREASGLRLCGRADEFGLDLLAGEWLGVTAWPMSSGLPPRIAVRDPSGSLVAEAPGAVLARADLTGRYQVIIAPASDEPVTYALRSAILTKACTPDGHEPNQAPHPPTFVGEGDFQAILCPADVDDYRFALASGQAASVTVRPESPDTDLTLTLFEEGVDLPLRTSLATGTERRVSLEAERDMRLVVRVSSGTIREVPYAFSLEVAGQGVLCEEDLLGPCPTWDRAPTLFEATWEMLKLCPGRADFFRTGLNGGETLSVAVEVDPGRPAPALAVLGEGGGPVLAEGEVAGDMALAEVVAKGPGHYYFRVGPAGDVAVPYTLSFWTREPEGDCRPDRLEPNDSPAQAATLPMGFTTHLTLCAGDRDVFGVKVGAFQAVSAILLFGTTAGHLSVQDAGGGLVATGSPGDYGEEVFYVTGQPGTLYLVVEPAAGPGWYDLGLLIE